MLQMINGEVVEISAEEQAAFEAARSAVPSEVARHRVRKAALLTPWPGYDSLLDAIYAAIDQLPAPKNALAKIEFEEAPNMQRDGVTTLAVMGILGMTAQQRDALLNFAASLA